VTGGAKTTTIPVMSSNAGSCAEESSIVEVQPNEKYVHFVLHQWEWGNQP